MDDERGVGRALAGKLAALGVDAHAVAQVSGDAAGVVFARGLLARDSQDEAIAVQRAALEAARALVRAHAAHANPKPARVFVTLQDTGGDFATSGRAGDRAWSGGLAGLVKTAAAEWPDAAVKAIDVAASGLSPEAAADRVLAELLEGGRDVEIALGPGGRRTTLRHRPVPYRPLPPARAPLRPGSVLIVSGGARGVTATSLVPLCAHRPRLALLGRTALVEEADDLRGAVTDADLRRTLLARSAASGKPLPPKEAAREAKVILDCREIRQNVAALEKAGAEVTYYPVDVRSAESVAACVGAIRDAWGPIHGIIHGAGVLADALIANQTDEQFDRVFGTKVDGLRHLLAATESDPLEILVLFASVAGRFGNSAQPAYAMANEVLSYVAADQRARRRAAGRPCVVRSLAWGPWAGGMVTPGLARLFEKAGVQLIALDAGAKALASEVGSDDDASQVVLMNGDPPLTAKPIHGGRVFDGQDRFDVVVNAATQPQLDGHRINGVPVVPAVMVLEWFLRAASICVPSLPARVCRDFRVLRGVPVEGFEGRGVRLAVQARVLASSATRASVEVKLVDAEDRPRYAAVVDLGEVAAPDVVAGSIAPHSGEAAIVGIDEAYAEALFHRGPFALVRALGPVIEGGASGDVSGLREAGWPEGGWQTDPAVVDAGLQVAIVWGRRLLGGSPLPTSFGAFHLCHAGPVSGAARCVVRGLRAGQRKVLVDIDFLTDAGAPVGYLRGLEMHVPPSLDRAAQTNGAA